MHSIIARLVYLASTVPDFQAQLSEEHETDLESIVAQISPESQGAALGALRHLATVDMKTTNHEQGSSYVSEGWFAPSRAGDSLLLSS